MTTTLAAFRVSIAPPELEPILNWGEKHISVPNSARTREFHRDTTPQLNEPLERSVDEKVKRLIILGPTGGSKTTLYDVTIPYGIANAWGSFLLAMQTDPDADEYCSERLMPIIDKCAPCLALMPRDRSKKHKNQIIFPHMSLFVGGANMTNAQRKSVTRVGIDEAWMIKTRGLIREFEARLHERWNGKLIITSQGGIRTRDEGDKDVEGEEQIAEIEEFPVYWDSTDRAEWCWCCPECGHVQPFLRPRGERIKRADGTTDWTASRATVHMACAGPDCRETFADIVTKRRMLAMSGRYVPTAVPEKEGYCGRHFNAFTLYWISWADLLVEWWKANDAKDRGDTGPLRIFIQKRLAEFWIDRNMAPEIALLSSKYSKAEYETGDIWPGETRRFLTVDCQKGHFWAWVRAWQPDGASRLLAETRIASEAEIVALQVRMKVIPALTFLDVGGWLGPAAYEICARHGYTALNGSRYLDFAHLIKKNGKTYPYRLPFSPVDRHRVELKDPATGKTEAVFVNHITWSNLTIKDRLNEMRGGRGPAWELPNDLSEDYRAQINSERRVEVANPKTNESKFLWVAFKKRNEAWDGEAMQVCCAVMFKVLGSGEVEAEEAEPESVTAG